MQVVPLMFAAELRKPAKLAVAEFLIETGRLETERIEKGVPAATPAGFVLGGMQ